MAFTYSDNPSSTGTAAQKRDAVRFLIQDTDTTNGKVTDAQIAWALAEEPNVYGAAARCCEALANKHGNISSRSVGDTSISYDHQAYATLATTLRVKARSGLETPYCGGLSQGDKHTTESDTDRVEPDFKRGLFEFLGTAQPGAVSGDHET
jgi:hypothetical protein